MLDVSRRPESQTIFLGVSKNKVPLSPHKAIRVKAWSWIARTRDDKATGRTAAPGAEQQPPTKAARLSGCLVLAGGRNPRHAKF